MKAAPAAVAVGVFFLVGLAGGAYWRNEIGHFVRSSTPPVAAAATTSQRLIPAPHEATVIAALPAPGSAGGTALSAMSGSGNLSSEDAAGATPPAAGARPESPATPMPTDNQASTDHNGDRPKGDTPLARAETPPLPASKPTPPARDERVAAKLPAPARGHADVRSADVRAPGGSGPFQVQFGVFSSEENANRLGQALSTPQVKISVQRSQDKAGHPLFYVRSPLFDDFARALAAAWDAQNAAQAGHFAEPVKYVILRVNTSSGVETSIAVSQETAGAAH
jgi:hypothetical protein